MMMPRSYSGSASSAVWIGKLEPIPRFQGVPLVHVTMDEDGAFFPVCVSAPFRAGERMVDGALRTWVIQLLPGCSDEVCEPSSLLGTASVRPQPGAGRHTRATVEQRISGVRLRIGSASW